MGEYNQNYHIAFNCIKLGMFVEFDEMIKEGFDINSVNSVKQNLLTQMFYVPLKSRKESILHLINCGIDVNYIDGENETALCKAVRANMFEVVKALLEKNADTSLGKNFTKYCLTKEHSNICSLLLSSNLITYEQREFLSK